MLGGYSPEKPIGGVQMHIDRLVHHLSRIEDVELHLITFGPDKKELKNGNLRIHVLKRWLPWYFYLPFEVLILRREILRIDPDIVHAHDTYLPYSTAAAMLSKKYPTLLTVHDVVAKKIKFVDGYRFLTRLVTIPHEKYVLSKIQNVIVCSQFNKDIINNITSSKVYVIPNGVNLPNIQNIQSRSFTKSSIFYVGMLLKSKGVDILISAIPIIKKSIPDVCLYIAGAGKEETNLKNLVKELNIEKNVKFLGFITEEEKYTYYKSVDIFVLPSLFEPFGLVLLEAMSCGKPVVASKVGGIPYIVEDGKTGLLFESENVEDLAEKIITLLKDEELRDNMGKVGRERAKEFTWEKVAESTVEVYNRIKNDWKN